MRRVRNLVISVGVLLAATSAGGCSAPPKPPPVRLTPPMGWNSWNSGIPLTERTVEQTVDAMVSSGMRDAGYRYVNLDAGWAAPTRDADGNLRADPARFPAGMAALARYTHDRGMLLGLYNSPFNEACGQAPAVGSAGHESADARTFARWGVDYLKYDWCRMAADHGAQIRVFSAMRDALRDATTATGRRILYSINPNSSGDPGAGTRYDWSDIADMNRNSVDLVPAWGDETLWDEGLSGVQRQFVEAAPTAPRSNPQHWNDPDMLVVGLSWADFVTGHPSMLGGLSLPGTVTTEQVAEQPAPQALLEQVGAQRPALTDIEQRSHFSLWAMLAAPLIAGNDIRSMSEQARAILTNRDVIAVDQDPLVVQGTALRDNDQAIVKRLADGAVAVALFNTGDAPATIATTAAAVGLPRLPCYTVRDLWAHADRSTDGAIAQDAIPAHGVALLRVKACT